MLLISEEELNELQQSALDEFYLEFLNNLEDNNLVEQDYQQPRAFIFELLKAVLVGRQEYVRLYSLVEEIMLKRKYLSFFDKVHTKQEIIDFVAKIY